MYQTSDSPPDMVIDEQSDGNGKQQMSVKQSGDEEVTSTSNEVISHSFRNYFCIFCDSRFDSLQNAFDHFKKHMSVSYYCKVCDYKLSNVSVADDVELNYKNAVCNIDHSQHEVDISKESTIIEMWIERFLSYQDEIQNKTDSSVITSTKFFLGCPACDVLIKECSVPVPKDVLEYREATYQSSASQSGTSPDAGGHHPGSTSASPTVPLFGGGKESVKCHTVRHACAHLRYYPYECFACEEIGKYQKKPDISEMMRHIKDTHVKNNFHLLLNQPIEQLVKFVRITKLEKFIEYYLKAHPMVRFDPVPSAAKRSKSSYIVSPGRASNAKSTAATPQSQRVPSILIKKTTLGTSSTYRTTQNHNSSAGKSQSTGLSILLNSQHSQSNLSQQSMTKTTSKGSFFPKDNDRSNFHRQFGNIFDEEMMSMAMSNEEDLNVEYFCIFCSELKTKDKEEARRHYQRHVDYYPLVCSLCGEGACDLSEFLKHHTSNHPNSEKGRYKRREQPQIDKWINGFLYAQSTIIRAFPPREQCLVCEKVFDPNLIAATKPRRCTINRKIDHFHRHLCYLPYECMKCKEEGKEFLVAYFESKAHSHIKLKHPDVDDQESRWFVFQKTTSIPKLDTFISSYLAKFGISMEHERRPVKKSHVRESNDFVHDGNNNLSLLATSSATAVNQPTESGSGSSDAESADGQEMIVSVSPAMVDLDALESHESNSFCLFCPTIFLSKFDAFSHFSSHLNYEPVVCLLCSSRFIDIDTFTIHHQKSHPSAPDLMYEVREDFVLEKWLDTFLLTQKSNQCKSNLLKCSCSSSCPVCERIFDLADKTPITGSCMTHSDSDFSTHVHQHLAYYDYECSLCKQNSSCLNTFKTINLDLSALDHVKRFHKKSFKDVENVTVYDLEKIFERIKPVPKIEEFIAESIGIRTFNEKKFRENDREKRAESTKSQNPTLNHLLGLSTVIPSQQSRRPTVPNQNYLQNLMSNAMTNKPQMRESQVSNHRSQNGLRPIFSEQNNNQKMRVVEQGNRMVLKLAIPKKHHNATPYSRVIPQPKKVSCPFG